MRPRYYVHMGPKVHEKVSSIWKVAHIFMYFLLLCSSSVATACIYNILDIYKFHCIVYTKVSFEQSYEDRVKEMDESSTEEETDAMTNAATNATTNVTIMMPTKKLAITKTKSLDCETNPNDPECQKRLKEKEELNKTEGEQNQQEKETGKETESRKDQEKDKYENESLPEKFIQKLWLPDLLILNKDIKWRGPTNDTLLNQTWGGVNITGFLNLRKTIFATIFFCDLMLFAPLASVVLAIFLGALIAVAGKGGAGNPGDLLPNPWICVYPFLALSCFMMIFSFIADNIFHEGLKAFCSRYYVITKEKSCSKKMDDFNIQFTPDRKGPARAFYNNYMIGSYGVQITSALWIIQTLIYIFRILCLADFQLYLTRIRLKEDDEKSKDSKDPKMANIVMEMMMESKTKRL